MKKTLRGKTRGGPFAPHVPWFSASEDGVVWDATMEVEDAVAKTARSTRDELTFTEATIVQGHRAMRRLKGATVLLAMMYMSNRLAELDEHW